MIRHDAPVAAEADTKLALLGVVAAQLGVAVVSSSLATLGRPGVVFRTVTDAPSRLVFGALHPTVAQRARVSLAGASQLSEGAHHHPTLI